MGQWGIASMSGPQKSSVARFNSSESMAVLLLHSVLSVNAPALPGSLKFTFTHFYSAEINNGSICEVGGVEFQLDCVSACSCFQHNTDNFQSVGQSVSPPSLCLSLNHIINKCPTDSCLNCTSTPRLLTLWMTKKKSPRLSTLTFPGTEGK